MRGFNKLRLSGSPSRTVRIQWAVFGVAVGIVTALGISPQTSWLVRGQFGLVVPRWNTTPSNPLNSAEIAKAKANANAVAAQAQQYAASHPSDIGAMEASNCYSVLADQNLMLKELTSVLQPHGEISTPPELTGTQNRYPTIATNSNVPVAQDTRVVSLAAAHLTFNAHPESPVAAAYYCRALMDVGMLLNRPETYWINQNEPETARSVDYKQWFEQAVLLEHAADCGAAADPHNAFFSVAKAVACYYQDKDNEALDAVNNIRSDDHFNSYCSEEAIGWDRVDFALNGRTLPFLQIMKEMYHPQSPMSYSCLMHCASVTVWKAAMLEHAGHCKDGLSLRLNISKLAYLYNQSNQTGFVTDAGWSLGVRSAMAIPGGKYIAPATINEDTLITFGCQTSEFVKYLERNGFRKEADYYHKLAQQYDRRLRLHRDRMLQPVEKIDTTARATAIMFGFAEWEILQTLFVAMAALVVGLAAYRSRFKVATQTAWNCTVWASVCGGAVTVFIAALALASLYGDRLPIGLIAVVVVPACVVALSVLSGRDLNDNAPIAFFKSGCCTMLAIIASYALMSSSVQAMQMLIQSQLAPVQNGEGAATNQVLEMVSCTLTLLAVPLILCYFSIAYSNVKYLPLNVGITEWAKLSLLPTISLLLIGYAATVIRTEAVVVHFHNQMASYLRADEKDNSW